MKITDLSGLGISEKFIEKFGKMGIEKLYEPQVKSLKNGLLDFENQVISAPTASGKTLIATLASINNFKKRRSKVLYLVPLIALADEKYKYFKKVFSDTKIKTVISTGDLDSSSGWLSNYDLLVLTTEKCDSLIRHDSRWLRDVGLIIVDEIHLLNDPSRGPTLEITLTKLREIVPKAQILALSATIKNSQELSQWLDAKLILSDFRPVKLYEGLYYNSKIQFFGGKNYSLNENLTPELSIVENTVSFGKQVIFFVSTRRNAESLAEKISDFSSRAANNKLTKISSEIGTILETPTGQCRKLSECVKNGIAFHHAGLLPKQKTLVEEQFKSGQLKVICATPTLAMGVNLPAWRIVVRDIKRYYSGYGSRFIPVLEVKQMFGRAGRPDFDKSGESILIAKSEREAHELSEKYILGEPEEIYSKLFLEPVLRMHTLSLISSGISSEDSLFDFFNKTFYAYQYNDIDELKSKIRKILGMLINFGFVVDNNGNLISTRIGKRVSELYLDPITANQIIESLKKSTKKNTIFSYLHLITNTLEMKPFFTVYKKEEDEIIEKAAKSHFLTRPPDEWDFKFDEFLRSVKTTLVLESWVNEISEDRMLTYYRVAPGDLRTKLKNADWILYATNELAILLGLKEILLDLRKLRVRMKYGVKEQLIPLVRLKQIGRVRARKLYKNNLRTIKDLRDAPTRKLGAILGDKIALSLKKQLGDETNLKKEITLNDIKGK